MDELGLKLLAGDYEHDPVSLVHLLTLQCQFAPDTIHIYTISKIKYWTKSINI